MSWLIEHMRCLGDRVAVSDYTGDYTYSELVDEIDRISVLYQHKISHGDIVSLLADYSFKSIAIFFWLYSVKCIVVPVASKVDDEIATRIELSCAEKIIRLSNNGEIQISSMHRPQRHELVEGLVINNRSGLILFSSGSSGVPKIILHDLDNLIDSYCDKKIKNLVILNFLLFDHIGGLNTLLNSLAIGCHIVLPRERDPAYICGLIQGYGINVLPASPTFLNMILVSGVSANFDLSSLRMITYGTESMPKSLLSRLMKAFPKVRFLQTFGTSETGISQTSSYSSHSLRMKLNDPNQEYKVIDGVLWIKSDISMLGYLSDSNSGLDKDGWFCTGDIVEVDNNGYMSIQGRANDIINVGGEKVHPSEVDAVLIEIDCVKDAVVYGEDNSITGQSVAAKVVLESDVDRRDAKRLIRKYCRTKLDDYKVPARLTFVDVLGVTERFKKIRA